MNTNPLMPLAELTPTALTWLWPGRLALGKLTMFDGDPGRGKSLVTLDLGARVTTGRPMPDGTGAAPPANVVIIQGEDGAADTVLPRLRALGADLSRVFVLGREYLEKHDFTLPTGVKAIEHALKAIKPRLLIIDPVMAFLDRRTPAHSDQSIRRALAPLGRVIAALGCACILVRHLNKSGQRRALYRGISSIGFNAVCRSSWLFAADPKDATRLIMAKIKNNFAEPGQKGFAYRIVLQADGQPIPEWLGPVTVPADDLLSRATGAEPATLRTRAADFLADFLARGPRSTEEIFAAGLALGLQKRTLQRAGEDLEITSKKGSDGERQLTYWLLGGQKLPATATSQTPDDDDISDLFAGVRAKYPRDPLESDEAD